MAETRMTGGRSKVARKKSLDQGPVLRQQILQSASHLFYDRGFAATSIRDIAIDVGISSSTMYHHFTNKKEILNAVVTRFMEDFNAATIPVLTDSSSDLLDRLRTVIKIHIEMSDERRPELLAGNPVRYALDATQREHVLGLQASYNSAVRTMIDEGVTSGAFSVPDSALATMALLDMLNGIREWYRSDGRVDRATIIREYTNFALLILGAKQSEKQVPLRPNSRLDSNPNDAGDCPHSG
jgi:AcrR family transcriptional regulator